jgi:hypothetical protein
MAANASFSNASQTRSPKEVDANLRVTPTVGEFSDVEPGMVFVIPFTIHNLSNRIKRVRFHPPKTSVFRLINTQQSIAPGMKQVIEVEFSSKEARDFHDNLVVRTDEGEITIPLHAWFPAPNLKFDPVVDLGTISSQQEPRRFKISNIGKKDGVFKFVVDPALQGLSLSPNSGLIAAGQDLDIALHFFRNEIGGFRGVEIGSFRGVVDVQVEGQPTRRLEVIAEVIESRVSLLDPLTQEPISRLQFGKLFFGQTKQLKAVLRNFCQHNVNFNVRPPEDPAGQNDDDSQHGGMPLDCKPTEGRVAAGESCELIFTFNPVMRESARGWEHSMKRGDELAREWDSIFSIETVETEQRLDLQLLGKALPTEVRLSETAFHFPTCAVNDHVDILFSFTNESSELPVTFKLSRVAHFRCSPTHGKVVPKGKQNVLLTFHPNQLGAFRDAIQLTINDGAKKFDLTVSGTATVIGPKPPIVGGIDKVQEDFVRPRKFATVAPQETHVETMRTGLSDDEASEPSWANDDDAAPDLLLLSEWQQKREHSSLYNNYLTNCRNIRKYNDRLRKGLMVDANPDDLGMVPGEGLTAPEPRVPRREDPLPFSTLAAEADDGKKADGSVALRKALKVDENKTVKKKFPGDISKRPLNEQRECKIVLSPKDIQNIVVPVKVLDFGHVSVYSTNIKSFFVYNGLKTHVQVSIPQGIRQELALSTPLCQIIPPGQMAGFDIVFRSETPQQFQQAIYFTVNENHRMKFVVFAEAVPIDLNLSHNELVFRFPDFGFEPAVTMPVTLTNTGNSDAEFTWVLPDEAAGAFHFAPSSGTVPANGTLTVDASYTPILASNETTCDAQLKVKGGQAKKALTLTGSVQAATCTWSVKDNRLDFKKVPVGSTKSQTITLRNTGNTSTVFAFDTTQLAPGVSVAPVRGRIAPGSSEDVLVQLRASTAQIVKSTLTCHVRGMKQLLKLALTAEAKVPEFAITEPGDESGADARLDFEGVYVGSASTKKFTIQNHDDVVSAFVVDLTHHPSFTLCDADRHPVEIAVAEDDDPPPSTNPAGQVMIYRPKIDDDLDFDGRSPDDEERNRRGTMYRVLVQPRQAFSFYMCFTPTVVGVVDRFVLPMSLAGTDVASSNLRTIVVSAEGKKPRLVMTPTLIDFGSRVVIREGTSKAANFVRVKLSNETDSELQWDIDYKPSDQHGDVFRVEPTNGRLMPGQTSHVQFTFTPLEVRSYSARYGVYLDGQRESKYMEIAAKGFGANPALTFDRKEIIMPTVPLDVPSKMTFFIGNEGFESLDLKYKIAGDGKLPVSLAFPDGQTITSTHMHSQLPVEVTFLSKKPMTFTVNIDFYDDADGIFSIPVTCCADNSLVTNYSYLRWREAGAVITSDGERKPLMLKEVDDSPIDKDTPRGNMPSGAKSDGGSTVGNTAAEEANQSFAAVDHMHKKTMSKRAIERLRVWLNVNVFPEPVEDLESALQNSHGRLLMDMIELLFGKPPPTGSGKAEGGKAGGGSNKKETALADLEQYDAMLLFLKQYGACVSDVRSEYLLRFEDYSRLASDPLRGAGASAAAGAGAAGASGASGTGSTTGASKGRVGRLSDRKFKFRSMHAWLTVVLQTLRVFYLSRITWRAFKTTPQSPAMAHYAAIEKWSSLQAEPSSSGSNIYSVPEGLLLKWLSMHLSFVYGKSGLGGNAAAAERREERPKAKADDGNFIRVTNFDSDLRDCRAFAAVLASYLPSLAAKFDPSKESGLVLAPVNSIDLEKNAALILDGMREFGMDVRTGARELLEHSARDNLLFAAFLYNTLPQYVPKTTIKFKGKLLENITKTIELTNPTKYAIDYSVIKDGRDSDDFILGDTKLHLEPKATASFQVSIRPRFARKVEARVMFLSGRGGTLSASTMVFGLETDVDPDSAVKVIDNLETPMYEPLTHELLVENPFAQNGHFSVQITQEYLRPASGKPFPEEESLHLFPDAFWTPTDSLQLKKLPDRCKFSLQFLPCVRGRFKARVMFRSDIGEFAYVFIGNCLPPKPFDTISMQTEAATTTTRDITIPVRHAILEKALAQKEERFKLFKGRGKAGTGKEMDAEGREVTYKVEFLNDKYVGPNPFFTGPKSLTVKPQSTGAGGAADDDAADDRNAGAAGGKKKRDATTKGEKPGVAGGQQHAAFGVTFAPKGPGTYNCYAMLVSTWDVRVLLIEGRSRAPGLKAEMQFNCPARQQITQEIPVTNGSDKEWTIAAQLTGEYFAGPREIRVPAGRTRNYPLAFNPTWVCDVSGQLVLRNNDTQEKVTYTLKAKAEEPLAENTIPVECRARESRKITINVPNITFDEVTYVVETDIPFVSGDPKIVVAKMEVGKYVLHIQPQLSGKITGSITFVAPNKQYVWFVLQVNVLRPPPEDKLTITSEVRKGVVCEIGIANPTNKAVDFIVRRRGEGLIGDDVISLEPKQSAAYQLAYAPTKAGEAEGVVSFNNDDIGEFWYRLQLTAKEAAPTPLSFQCELGKSMTAEAIIENPTDVECLMSVSNSNDVNFSVTPSNLTLRPKGSLKVFFTYMPSAIQTPQEALIKLIHPKAGMWEYRCRGVGLPPTRMETVSCVAQVGRAASSIVMFRNPFPVPKRFLATLKPGDGADDEHVFTLMSKKQSTNLGPFQTMQIPLSYNPQSIAQHRASIVVQLLDQADSSDLRWEFPVQGVAEHVHGEAPIKLSCKSRRETSIVLPFALQGLTTRVEAEEFLSELVVGRDVQYRRAAVNALSIRRATHDEYIARTAPDQRKEVSPAVYFEFVFAPLRPFSVAAELLVRKASGGTWRFAVQLDATPPDADDQIVIEAAVNVLETVSFQLYNVLPEARAFVAYFSPDSPQEFQVQPTKGVLPPMPTSIHETRQSGQAIDVSFTSSQYGKTLTGTLIIETEDMQWRYEVRGTLPKYQPPTGVRSKVNNRLRADTEATLRQRVTQPTPPKAANRTK